MRTEQFETYVLRSCGVILCPYFFDMWELPSIILLGLYRVIKLIYIFYELICKFPLAIVFLICVLPIYDFLFFVLVIVAQIHFGHVTSSSISLWMCPVSKQLSHCCEMFSTDLLCTWLQWILAAIITIKFIAWVTLGRTKSNVCLVGKTVLITGGNLGIGYQTALILAGRGARVIIAHRNNAKLSGGTIIRDTHNSNIIEKIVDLTSLQSIRSFAKDINETEERLDILINNAGIGSSPQIFTEDGLLTIMQTNHLGGFLLTHLLLDLIKKSAPSRIIFVNSLMAFINNLFVETMMKPSNYLHMYGNSKLCNIITANIFAKKLAGSGVTCNSVHPGVVITSLYEAGSSKLFVALVYPTLIKVFGKSPYEGAQPIVDCALSNELKDTTGEFFIDCKQFVQPYKARDKAFCEKIWKKSEEFVHLKPSEKI